MKKSARAAVLAACMILTLAGCTAKAPGTTPAETPPATEATTTTPAATTTTTAAETTTVADNVRRSPTTGMPVEADTVYRPVACVISNAKGAAPQWELKRADVVYEFLQEGRSVTRFLAIFNDDVPDDAGPVRSCRFPFLDILAMWEAPLAFCGGSSVAPVDVDTRIVSENLPYYIDDTKGRYSEYFWRDSSRKAPHNLRVNLQQLREDTPEWDYPEDALTFSEAAPQGTSVSKIQVNFTSKYEVAGYQYDPQQKLWLRYWPDGDPMEDADGTQLAVTNLVVLKMNYKTLDTSAGHLELESTGSGEALFFMNGVEIEGTWEREKIDEPLVLKNKQGEAVSLMPGKSWFCVVDDEAPIVVE